MASWARTLWVSRGAVEDHFEGFVSLIRGRRILLQKVRDALDLRCLGDLEMVELCAFRTRKLGLLKIENVI